MGNKITGVQAALMEAKGEGNFSVEGRNIVFRSGALVWTWAHSTTKEAEITLKVLRAAPKYQREAA